MRSASSHRVYWALVVLAAIGTVAATLFGRLPWAAFAPAAVIVTGWALWKLPLRYPVLAVLGMALLFDNPSANPMQGRWHSPLYGPGRLLYENLNTTLGLSAIHVSALEVLFVALLLALLVRRIRGEVPPASAALRPLLVALVVMFTALVALEVLGLATGGDRQQSLWQIRQLLWLPALVVLAIGALRDVESRRLLPWMIVGIAAARASVGLFYWLRYLRPQGIHPHYLTTHSDSVIFVIALLFLLHALVEHRRLFHALTFFALGPLIGLALVLNDRRLAYVSLVFGLVTSVYLLRRPLRRIAVRLVVVASPLIVAYVALGWGSHSKLFAPVGALTSVSEGDDASSRARRIEDLNLVYTLHAHPVVGTGFGHPYGELVESVDLGQFFTQYRYLPHNSVLWLWSVGGLLGFAAVWLVLPVALFIAVRTYRRAPDPSGRLLALVAVLSVISFEVQAFGDIGMQDWTPFIVLVAAVGAASNLAVKLGALGGARAATAADELAPIGGVS